MVVGEIQLTKVRTLTLVKHVLKVTQLARRQVEIADVFKDAAIESRGENLFRKSAGEGFLCLLMLLIVDREAIEDAKLAQVEDAVDAIIVAELNAHQVSRDVEDD